MLRLLVSATGGGLGWGKRGRHDPGLHLGSHPKPTLSELSLSGIWTAWEVPVQRNIPCEMTSQNIFT